MNDPVKNPSILPRDLASSIHCNERLDVRPLLVIQPNKFARFGWPLSRLTNLVNLKMLN
jgi:hypothetical protein